MAEHRLLTGDQLHEPKGIDTASIDQIYVATGSGTGIWLSRFAGNNNLNKYTMSGRFDDISAPSSVFLFCPQKGLVTKLSGVLNGPITGANATITLYKNGVITPATLVIPFTASTAGTAANVVLSPYIAVNENDVLELRSDGASSTTAAFSALITLSATQ
jgi:hypothetical protein